MSRTTYCMASVLGTGQEPSQKAIFFYFIGFALNLIAFSYSRLLEQ